MGARLILLVLVFALQLAACAADPNSQVGTATEGGDAADFWLGLWHGIIAPVTFMISLFTDEVNLYEVHNTPTRGRRRRLRKRHPATARPSQAKRRF